MSSVDKETETFVSIMLEPTTTVLDCHYRCFITQYDINNEIMTKQVTFPFDTTQVTPYKGKHIKKIGPSIFLNLLT